MSMRSLPTEVSENILVCAAADGYPTTISAVGQTCRQLRELIYNPSDTHLWREVFLTTFDDPRDCQFLKFDHFDWGAEFRIRIWAKTICSETRLLCAYRKFATCVQEHLQFLF
ncbi:hypothetical protein A0H81_07264 [Grifola frondosa]|uniref:F-box domain-containing protein n=1 Tax=Grifola frondosa TaxID=5627 RepID=A0A1C7M810_GRIFR|nr:hypothetical protein A0H81_07264 [Grifola frondosa]